MSLLVQLTVLFTPITTVIIAGEKPGEFSFAPAPCRILTRTAFDAAAVVACELFDELE